MTTAERREAILAQLGETPVAARTLANRYGVSRQIIAEPVCTREFKVRHGCERSAQELNLIVDCGGRVKSISISHRVYGRVSAEMDIQSRRDVVEFLQRFEDSSSTVLSTVTDGYHYHLVEAATAERLDLIERELREQGFLAPLQPWEK